MLFNSYLFLLVFLPTVLIGGAAASRLGRHCSLIWLASASLVFYGWWNGAFVPLLVASIAGNYVAAGLIARTEARPWASSALLIGAIAADLSLLVWCKVAAAVQPPGISFFTFTQIGYLLDCQTRTDTRRNALEYALFVGFFPHVIAGPIPTAKEFLPQLADAARWRPSAHNLALGGGIFVIGLLKKTLLADPLAASVAQGFADPAALTLLPAWHAAMAWSLQLYFDFSGYSDMAIGLGQMFNLRYPANFASPYKAQSVIDYWQRWHMTLTRFLTYRVYTPLTVLVLRYRRARGWPVDRNAQRRFGGFMTMLALPLLTTMGVVGVWHGNGWTFLFFGLLHGAFLAVNHAWRLLHRTKRSDTVLAVLGRVALTYACVLVGAVVFRAPSVSAALALLHGMMGGHGVSVTAPNAHAWLHGWADGFWLLALYGVVWLAPNTQQIMEQAGRARRIWQPTLPWAVAFGCAATLGLLSLGGTGEFVYFRF